MLDGVHQEHGGPRTIFFGKIGSSRPKVGNRLCYAPGIRERPALGLPVRGRRSILHPAMVRVSSKA
ncbi:MAG TPA: hypothetical protein VJZ50_08180, partial [Candidatus Limnocylindrales bacterium]|nr:hypothetical protein [Candidatus Limnocylindrales bacterium]